MVFDRVLGWSGGKHQYDPGELWYQIPPKQQLPSPAYYSPRVPGQRGSCRTRVRLLPAALVLAAAVPHPLTSERGKIPSFTQKSPPAISDSIVMGDPSNGRWKASDHFTRTLRKVQRVSLSWTAPKGVGTEPELGETLPLTHAPRTRLGLCSP